MSGPASASGRVFPAGFFCGGSPLPPTRWRGRSTRTGRGASTWDTWAHTPGVVVDGSTGDVACNHDHRFREDVELMASIGLGAHRFSVCGQG
jgi:beta-glucosidase